MADGINFPALLESIEIAGESRCWADSFFRSITLSDPLDSLKLSASSRNIDEKYEGLGCESGVERPDSPRDKLLEGMGRSRFLMF